MHDFAADRPKKLDLVIARPVGDFAGSGRTFSDLPELNAIELTPAQRA